MSRYLHVGNFDTGDGDLIADVRGYSASKWSVLYNGVTFSGGTVTLYGGDGIIYELVKVTDLNDGTFVDIALGGGTVSQGLVTFDALCSYFKFTLSGSTSPLLSVFLFPEPRS